MRIDRLLIATSNAGKTAEFRQMLGRPLSTNADVASREVPAIADEVIDFTSLPTPPEVEETGDTFLENACLKATGYAKHFACWALADDSGLAVDALGGKPGVHSARWAKLHDAGAGDADNNRLLLRQLEATPDDARAAHFACALALSDPQGRIVATAQGRVNGSILRDPRGPGGFGYDPLFLIEELGKTTAELPAVEKHAISHRGRATRRLIEVLASL